MELHLGDRCKQQAVTTAMKSKSNGKGWQGAGSLIPEQLPEHSLREDHSRLRNWQGHCGHRGLSKAWRQEREGGTQGGDLRTGERAREGVVWGSSWPPITQRWGSEAGNAKTPTGEEKKMGGGPETLLFLGTGQGKRSLAGQKTFR